MRCLSQQLRLSFVPHRHCSPVRCEFFKSFEPLQFSSWSHCTDPVRPSNCSQLSYLFSHKDLQYRFSENKCGRILRCTVYWFEKYLLWISSRRRRLYSVAVCHVMDNRGYSTRGWLIESTQVLRFCLALELSALFSAWWAFYGKSPVRNQ